MQLRLVKLPNSNEADHKCLTGRFFRVLHDHCGVLPLDV